MSNLNNSKIKPRDHSLSKLPSGVIMKARSTLLSLGGVLKTKQDQQRSGLDKQDSRRNNKVIQNTLKSSKSEPEFGDMQNVRRRSRIDEKNSYIKKRPLSVGASKRALSEMVANGATQLDSGVDRSPISQKYISSDISIQSRLAIPDTSEKVGGPDVPVAEVIERPRKKLSFREPEIEGSDSTGAGRSHKLMGVNSLSRRQQRVTGPQSQDLQASDNIDSDLESMAMRIVRTVGQAFEVCHKQKNESDSAPASSCADDASTAPASAHAAVPAAALAVQPADSDQCGVSETEGSELVPLTGPEEPATARPLHLDLLPPPPRKEGRRSPQRTTLVTPSSALPELPECVTRVEISKDSGEEGADTPLSAQHQLQLLRERLEQQAQQTRAAVAQLLLLRDQLSAEQAARCEAQARTHQLLVHNKELLEHIAALVAHLQARERTSSATPRPISAQQLTMLPQTPISPEYNNGNENAYLQEQRKKTQMLVKLLNQSEVAQSINNNNVPALAATFLPSIQENGTDPLTSLGKLKNQDLEDYLITKIQGMGGLEEQVNGQKPVRPPINYNQHFFQNSNAFPNIPPLNNDISNMNSNSFNQKQKGQRRGSRGVEMDSLSSTSPAGTSKESSPEAFSSDDCAPFIMPLSHKGTLTAKSEDGRVRLIVPVSPSSSEANVAGSVPASLGPAGSRLTVPALPGPSSITRTTSEKVPRRSDMMSTLRAQWTRHTTK